MYSSNTMRNTLLRRSSIQGNKPPPPIRRTASITNTNRTLTPVGSLEHLPPPPAFLLESSAAGSPPIKSSGAGIYNFVRIKNLSRNCIYQTEILMQEKYYFLSRLSYINRYCKKLDY